VDAGATGEREDVKKSVAHTFIYPAQEYKIGQGQDVLDPRTRKNAGEILELDREARTLKLKRGPSLAEVPTPEALIRGRPYDTHDQEHALERIGRAFLEGTGRYPAIETILRRSPFDRPVQTTKLDEMVALLHSLDGRHLVIQGPPGSGKTWTSGRLIAGLVGAGKSVGDASTSHKAIHKLLAEVEAAAVELGVEFSGLKKASGGNPESTYGGDRIANAFRHENCGGVDVLGGTAWLFADECFDGTLDYLFIDEAGQVSLADAIAMATCARNVVLVGDPQQLGQVLQGSHPAGSEASVLEHLLAGDATIAPERGLFLERTLRLHPDVCEYISEEFYERRLVPDPVTSERTTPLGTGLRWIPVEHEGRRQDSEEEVEAVRAEIGRLRAAGVSAAHPRRPHLRGMAPSSERRGGLTTCHPCRQRHRRRPRPATRRRGRRPRRQDRAGLLRRVRQLPARFDRQGAGSHREFRPPCSASSCSRCGSGRSGGLPIAFGWLTMRGDAATRRWMEPGSSLGRTRSRPTVNRRPVAFSSPSCTPWRH
jgi:hypothetical protein